MENYKLAKKLYAESKFETAIERFKESFNNEVLNENEKIDCLTQIIKIQKIINKKEDSEKIERDLADFLIKRKEYSSASEVLFKLVNKKRTYDVNFELINTLILEGRLEKAEEETLNLFKYLYRKKNFEKSNELYKFASTKFPANKKFDSFYMLSLIVQGNFEELEKLKVPDEDILFETLASAPFNHWRHSKLYFSSIIRGTFQGDDYNLNKLGLKLLLEKLLLGSLVDEETMETIVTYFLRKERKTVLRLLSNFADEIELHIEEKLTNKIDSLPEDDAVDTELDLGQDLLSEDDENSNEVDRLVENIELLKNMGEEEEADVLLAKLKRVDPENKIFVKEATGTKLKVKRLEVEDLEQAWAESFRTNEDGVSDLRNRARATLSSISIEELERSYADIVVCFNTMDLFDVSLEVFRRIDELNIDRDLKKELEYKYLLIKTLMGNQEYFTAYDVVTQLNGETPIAGEKRIEFLYLQGEIARKLGRKKDAIKSYLLVRGLNPNYRLVRQRLLSFG